MGVELLVYSRRRHPELEDAHTHYVSLDELYARSDVISLHCPMNRDSAGMICRAALDKMKDGVILLNTARGGLIVEDRQFREMEIDFEKLLEPNHVIYDVKAIMPRNLVDGRL